MGKKKSTEDIVFTPHWPDGLEQRQFYRVACDDKGRDGGSWLQVMSASDGDMHVSMQDWEDIKERSGSVPTPFPSIRVRVFGGGGRHHRTHQALLWLAQAIRLDEADLGHTPLEPQPLTPTSADAAAGDARDAARYRWLRDHVRPWEGSGGYPCVDVTIRMDETRKTGAIGQRDGVGICTLDTAVDMALAQPVEQVKP